MARATSLLTVVISIPLFLSYNIKYQRFPEGIPYVLLYTSGLLSVWVTPVLVLLGLVVCVRILQRSGAPDRAACLAWNVPGVLVAVIAEVVFIMVRRMPP
jgi:hypothetical protein